MILALQTTDATTRLWLFRANNVPVEPLVVWESGRQLADELLGEITQLLKVQKQSLASLEGMIIYSGPGSFTSLRIGHTVANALADSLNIPVVGAAGAHWLAEGTEQLASTKPGVPALPIYGAEANITRPASKP